MIQHFLGLVHLLLRFPQPKSRKNKVNQKSAIYLCIGGHGCSWQWQLLENFKAHLRRAATIFAPQRGGKMLAARDLCRDRERAWRWRTLKDNFLDLRIFGRNMATDKDNKVYSCLFKSMHISEYEKGCLDLWFVHYSLQVSLPIYFVDLDMISKRDIRKNFDELSSTALVRLASWSSPTTLRDTDMAGGLYFNAESNLAQHVFSRGAMAPYISQA